MKGDHFCLRKPVAQNGLDVALVGVFEDEGGVRLQAAFHLRQRQRGIRHVMQGADHGGAVEDAVNERQVVDIGGDDSGNAGNHPVWLAGLFQLRAGVIQQGDLFVAVVARGVASGAGTQFKQVLAAWQAAGV